MISLQSNNLWVTVVSLQSNNLWVTIISLQSNNLWVTILSLQSNNLWVTIISLQSNNLWVTIVSLQSNNLWVTIGVFCPPPSCFPNTDLVIFSSTIYAYICSWRRWKFQRNCSLGYTPIISWSLWMKQDVHVISPWLLPGVRFVCVRCVYMKRVMVFIKSHYEPRWSRLRIARVNFNTSTWARQKLHRFAATTVVGVNGLEKVTTAQMAIWKFLCFTVVSFFFLQSFTE